jgi:hypothetical protein
VREMTYLYGRAASGTPKSCWRGRALQSFSYSAAAPVLRLECLNPSILKPASRPVIPQRLNCSCPTLSFARSAFRNGASEAEGRDGAARSSDEGSVMELERGGCVVQPGPLAN